jgi:hypothetical protein
LNPAIVLDAAFRTQHVDGLGLLDGDSPDIVLHRSAVELHRTHCAVRLVV